VDAESNLKSALGGMAGMPGTDMPPAKPVPAKPDSSRMKRDAPRKVPPAEDHSMHGMADTVTTRNDSIRREE
jgi:hypothetical protein